MPVPCILLSLFVYGSPVYLTHPPPHPMQSIQLEEVYYILPTSLGRTRQTHLELRLKQLQRLLAIPH